MLDVHMLKMHIGGMTLNEYLATATDENGKTLTDEAFGRLCGMSQSQISRLRNSKSRPSFEAIEAIIAATGSKVTPNDWFEVAAMSEDAAHANDSEVAA